MRIHAQLFAEGKLVAEAGVGDASRHLSFWGLDIGRDAAVPVSDAYEAPFAFPQEKLDRIEMRFFESPDPENIARIAGLAE